MATTKSPADAEATMVANLKQNTGKSLDEWLMLMKDKKGDRHGVIVAHLKGDHGMTHGYANLVAHKLLKSDAGSVTEGGTDLVAEQYAGAKAPLRPLYDALAAAIADFGT